MLVAMREPTPCYHDAYSVGIPEGAYGEKSGQSHYNTTVSPLINFLVSKRTLYFSGEWFGCCILVGLGILGLGDLAMDSCAQFLAVAEHRLIPARARSVGHQLRKAGFHSIWAPACQDSIPGGHAGVGVVSLSGAPLALPSFVTPEFRGIF